MHLLLLLSFFFFGFPSALADVPYSPKNGVLVSQASFFPPLGSEIPFWEIGGSTMVTESYVRLTSNLQSQRGWIWTTKPLRFRDWETKVQFSVGSDAKYGADGLGVWFTKDRMKSGPIVGNTALWDGFGVIVDTFDNDGQKDNPQIYVLVNDNKQTARPEVDGRDLYKGKCRVNSIRQSSPHPESKSSQLLIRYKENVLTVLYDISEIIGGERSWVECFSTPLQLDDMLTGYYLGVTAETGGLTDYHDVMSVTTWSLQSPREEKQIDPDEAKNLKINSRDLRNSQEPTDRRGMVPIRPRRPGIDPNAEIVNRFLDLEKKEERFTSDLDSKFSNMINKLQTLHTEKFQTLISIETSLDTLGQSVDTQKLQDLKNNLKSALKTLGEVQARINTIEAHVEGTYKKATEMNLLQFERSNELLKVVEQSGSWGFWTYFMVFQIFIWLLFVWWRGKKEEKKRWM